MRAACGVFLVICVAYVSGKSFPSEISSNVPETCNNVRFACQDLHIARKCKAVSACIEVWETIKVPGDNNEICDLCKQMVEQARDQLLSNETQEELKEVFEGSCNLLPIKAIAAECRKAVDELVPEIIEMLASRMDPNQVCTVAGLCNNGLMKNLIKKQYVSAKPLMIAEDDGKKCKRCVKGMVFVRKALKYIPENEFTSIVLRSCMGQFKGNHAQCSEVVSNVLPFYKYIVKNEEESVCVPLGYCKSFFPDHSKEECKICARFVGSAKSLPKLELPLKMVKNFSLDLCNKITQDSASKSECEAVINYNFEKVTHILWNKQDPKTVCYKPCGIDSAELVAESPIQGKKVCSVCEVALEELKNKALNPGVLNDTIYDLKKLCTKTGNFEILCQAFVDNYFEMIYTTVINSLKPDGICAVLRLCAKNQSAEMENHLSTAVCKMCSVYNTFDVHIKDKYLFNLKRVIENKLEKTCGPKFEYFDCDKFVQEASPIVYNFLRVGNPGVFCSHMEHCPALDVPPPTYGDNLTCEFCEALVQYLSNVISAKSTEEEFRTAFKNMCKDLKEFSTECTNLVDEYFDQLYDFLIKNLQPEAVCSTLGLCDNSVVRHRIMMKLTPQPHVPVLLSKAEQRNKMLKNNKPIELVKLNPSTRVQPIKLRKAEKIPAGIEVEASKNTKDRARIVPLTRIESNSVRKVNQINALPVLIPNVVVENDIECSFCKAAVMFMEQRLESNKSEERIRKALDEVCSIFPTELSSQCQDFVNTYTEMFVTLIIQEANPNVICAVLKVCSVQDAVLPRDFNDDMKLTPKVNLRGVTCDLCSQVMQYIENYIGNNRTEAQIKAALEKVCSELPSSISEQCIQFVDDYADIIITLLTRQVDPSMVCAALGFCPGVVPQEFNDDLKLTPKVNLVTCELCRKVMQYIENYIGNNKTEAQIKAALEKVCSELPSSYSQKCIQFVDEYADIIITLLTKEVAPSMICAALGLCPGDYGGGQVECTLCNYVLHFLQTRLMENSTEEQIKEAVEKVCSDLPKTLADNCNAFVEEFGSSLIVLLAQKLDPSVVCVNLKICSSSSRHITFKPKPSVTLPKLGKCDVCEMVVNYVDKVLENDDVDTEITSLVEKVCVILPTSVRDECTGILNIYGPYILQMIGQTADSKSVCAALELCSETAKVQLLGVEKCTFGPSYWCQSVHHATACKAHEYCKKKVWKM